MRARIPDGPWNDKTPDVEQCDVDAIRGTALWREAQQSRIDPTSHIGQRDVWFRYEDKGFGVLWEPAHRNGLQRISSLFVRESARGQGIGRALVVQRFRHALDRPDIDAVDTYAHFPEFFYRLGFEYRYKNELGTHYFIYEKE